MKTKITSKYLVFPINTSKEEKRLKFFSSGKLVYALDIRLDNDTPDFYAYIEMTPFKNLELELVCVPEYEITFKTAESMDEIPNLYREPRRPSVHFTAKHGWINDPNGLVYCDGLYHMFYQYNPAAPLWSNMHWGHAVSSDLVRWTEKDIALYPDMLGEMFSGSAFVDKKNVLGLSKDGNDAVLLFYTACGRRNLEMDPNMKSSQCLAVSTDNCRTFQKYNGNPIVPPIAPYNRDPKVIYCDELDCFIMALYTEEHERGDYSLLASNNLITWERIYDYHIEGEWEFPDIMKFKGCDGRNKYILTSNTDCYIVLEVRNGSFERIQNPRKTFYCSWNHSPLSFDNVPDGRCIRAIWETFDKPLTDEGFCGQIIALEYGMEEKDGVYYLHANPLPELESLCKRKAEEKSLEISETPYVYTMSEKACLIEISGECDTENRLMLEIFGLKLCFDFENNEIKYSDEKKCPMNITGEGLSVKILVDKCGFEVFSDGGKSCFYAVSADAFPDYGKNEICISALCGKYRLDTFSVCELGGIFDGN